jgi:BASS family bile acid:Na+ symporter
MLATYVVAAIAPSAGLRIRQVQLGEVSALGESLRVTVPVVMLAALLLNAGLGVNAAELRRLIRDPSSLLLGLLANFVVPIAFLLVTSNSLRFWHNADEVQQILVGLALVGAMPIAGSSTAWSQNAEGNLALSLGLVVFSTLLSPFTTPLALHAVGCMTEPRYAARLHELASHGTGAFLVVCAVVPSGLGIGLRAGLGNARIAAIRPVLKLINVANLLALSYINAAVSLPTTVANPDIDYLAAIVVIATMLCALGFLAGWRLARWRGLDHPSSTSWMFALGMNNNGTGLVLASLAFADHPGVLLPIIVYNLVQHVVAACAATFSRRCRLPDATPG